MNITMRLTDWIAEVREKRMSENSKIEWTDATDNIIVVCTGGHWCRKYDDGCIECYAEALNQNTFFGGNKLHYIGKPPDLKLRTEMIDGWARKTKPKKRFVASMTDVCGEWVPQEWIFYYLDGMRAAHSQTFQILTKRGDVMQRHFSAWLKSRDLKIPPANIWTGVTLVNQKAVDRHATSLRALAEEGWLTWVSYEPALGLIDWSALPLIKWLVSGGESGTKARPSHPDWHRAARDFCWYKSKASYFFKQWGGWKPVDQMDEAEMESLYYPRKKGETPDSTRRERYPSTVILLDGSTGNSYPHGAMTTVMVGKKRAGRELDGAEISQFPQVK